MSWQRERERYFGEVEERKFNPRLIAIASVLVVIAVLAVLAFIMLPWQGTPATTPRPGPSLPVP